MNYDWFSILTLFGTFITAVVTLITVLEIKKQREASYHPELYLGNQSVVFYGHKVKGLFLPFRYSTERQENIKDWYSHSISMDITNLGFAAAKAIEYEWSFDIELTFKTINKANSVGFFEAHLDRKFLRISALVSIIVIITA